jgi:hypothetical protein
MYRYVLIILYSIFPFFNEISGSETMSKVVHFPKKNVAIVSFPTDGGKLTDLIINAFTEQLTSTGMPIQFTNYGWIFGEDPEILVARMVREKPDIVFLPDDMMYKTIAPFVEKYLPESVILFSSTYLKIESLNIAKKQMGVHCDPPIKNLMQQANKFTQVKSIGIVGGPFSKEIIATITEKLDGLGIAYEVQMTEKWSEYAQALFSFSKKFDAVWPLSPFGVKSDDQTSVGAHQFNLLLKEIDKPSLGYGRINGFVRTIHMDIDPVDIGRNSAALAFKYFRGESVGIVDFTSYSIRISDEHMKRLKLSVPKELIGFITM